LPLLAATFLVRCFNAVFAAVKYHSFVFLHTWGNKLSGLLVFIAPLPYMVWHSDAIIWTVCMVCILAAIEEGLIHLTSAEPDPDRRSIFS
jgi:CDP-diacylglycerol--glycerol-3-phosphate 3-phosphatidyltransferase